MSEEQLKVLNGLLQIYTIQQLNTVLQQSRKMASDGYGTLAIIFHQRHPYRLEVSTTISLSLKQQTSASE